MHNAGFQKTTLSNGLRFITVPRAGMTTTVLVLVEAGSKYETKDINGLSHFLEHMCFKGTEKRPKSIDITSALDRIGARYNAFTSHEYTGYYAKAAPEHLETMLDLVSDLYIGPVFHDEEIRKEKGVIVEEINMYEDLPMSKVHDVFMSLLYGDQPAGWSIAGTKDVVRALTRDHFLAYRGGHYVAGATIVVVAGEFDEKAVVSRAEQYFSSLPRSTKPEKARTTEAQSKPEVAVHFKETDQTHLILGVRGYSVFDERKYALEMVSEVLGGGMSSRLFQRIREELGAAYYVRTETDLYTDHGYLALFSGVDHLKLEKVIEVALEEFKMLKDKPIASEELERAKEHFIGNFIQGLETSDELAGFYGIEEALTRATLTPEEIIAKIRRVSKEEIQSIASDIFRKERLNLAVLGPVKDKEKFEKILDKE